MVKLKNSYKATSRLALALKKSEKMAIWSDYDPDGVFGLVLAFEALINAGFKKKNVKLILPNQQKYGRSFNKFHLQLLKKQKIKLILGIDFGTTDFRQVSMAKKMGFEIILLDHHRQRPGELPALLINPWQKGDRSKYKNWSGAGVAYLFFENFYKILKINPAKLYKTLDLLLIPAITDHIKVDSGNLFYLRKSLNKIKTFSRPGLKTSLKNLRIDNISLKKLIKKRKLLDDFYGLLKDSNDRNNIFKLLTCNSREKAVKISKLLKKQLYYFNAQINKIIKKGITKFEFSNRQKKLKFIFWGINKEMKSVGGAGKITQELNEYFKKPAYFYFRYKNMFKGSIRANRPNDNVLEAIKSCSNLFVDYGGHPKAAGFYIKKKNLSKLQKALEKYYARQ